MDGPRRLRAALVGAGLLLGLDPAAGAPLGTAEVMGAWDFVLDGSPRKCRVTFSADPAASGMALRFPVGCRRALPILNGAGGWTVADGVLRVLDPKGEPLLAFRAGAGNGALVAVAEGATYRLERQDRSVAAARLPPPPPIGVPQETPIDPATAPRPETLPGLYAVDRYTEKDVCRLDLRPSAAATAGWFETRILEGCRDGGIAAFEPQAWRYEAGRLRLAARRGHTVTLVSDQPGRWRRDPEVGATLILRKTAP